MRLCWISSQPISNQFPVCDCARVNQLLRSENENNDRPKILRGSVVCKSVLHEGNAYDATITHNSQVFCDCFSLLLVLFGFPNNTTDFGITFGTTLSCLFKRLGRVCSENRTDSTETLPRKQERAREMIEFQLASIPEKLLSPFRSFAAICFTQTPSATSVPCYYLTLRDSQ
jgi:hypothetical protein